MPCNCVRIFVIMVSMPFIFIDKRDSLMLLSVMSCTVLVIVIMINWRFVFIYYFYFYSYFYFYCYLYLFYLSPCHHLGSSWDLIWIVGDDGDKFLTHSQRVLVSLEERIPTIIARASETEHLKKKFCWWWHCAIESHRRSEK